MSLYLIRHTTPDIAAGVCYGLMDLDVAASFDDEAARLLARLPISGPVISSPLKRCRRLAEYLADRLQQPLSVDERLREMDFNRWEGRLWDDISRAELDAWSDDFLHARPHDGESVAMLRDRTLAVLGDIQAAHEKALVVTHSGVVRAAMARGDTLACFQQEIGFGDFVEWSTSTAGQ